MVSDGFTRGNKQRKIEISDLCEDLLEKILVHVPLNPRTRLKRVSKGWCKVITNLRNWHSQTTSSGLILMDDDTGYTANLLYVQDQGKQCILQRSVKVLEDQLNIEPWLLVSFRGFLLYHRRSMQDNSTTLLYVTNHTLYSNRSHYFALPPIYYRMFDSFFFRVGLYPHESGKREEFNVICFSTERMQGKMDCYLLSSSTMEWIKRCDVPIYNQSLSLSAHVALRPQCAYNNRKLYWLYGILGKGLMLVYNIDGDFFKFVELPPEKSKWGRYDLLYVSEDGCLCYCEMISGDIIIWTYLGNDDNGEDDGQPLMRWRITHNVTKCKLMGQMDEAYESEDIRDVALMPIAFNAELHTLYLADNFIVWAYSIETQKITKVWRASSTISVFSQTFDFSPIETT